MDRGYGLGDTKTSVSVLGSVPRSGSDKRNGERKSGREGNWGRRRTHSYRTVEIVNVRSGG